MQQTDGPAGEGQEEGSERDDGDDETETETEGASSTSRSLPQLSQVRIRGGPQKILGVMHSAAAARGEATEDESVPQQVQVRGGPSKFEALLGKDGLSASQGSRKSLGEEAGSVSTDSEWEKLSDREGESYGADS